MARIGSFLGMARGAVTAMAIAGAALGAHASATTPSTAKIWTAQPEKGRILSVSLNGKALANRVRSYAPPSGQCLILGDLTRALDLPVAIDLGRGVASGFTADGKTRIEVDLEGGSASVGKRIHSLRAGDIIEVPEGWCVKGEAVARWFGLDTTINRASARLTLRSDTPQPVEMAIARRQAAPKSAKSSTAMAIRLPYRLWKADTEGNITPVPVKSDPAARKAPVALAKAALKVAAPEPVAPIEPKPVSKIAEIVEKVAPIVESVAQVAAPAPASDSMPVTVREAVIPESAPIADEYVAKMLPEIVEEPVQAPAAFVPAAMPTYMDGWVADPEMQFLLDVDISRLRLNGGVRAYDTPGGACVVFEDFTHVMDVPITLDAQAQTASGWAFREKNTIEINRKANSVTIKGKREAFAETEILDVPEGWCVDSAALARWFGIEVEARTNMSLLLLDSEEKLPIQMAVERRARANALMMRKAALPTEKPTEVKIPYRLWRAPALDVVLDMGVGYSKGRKIKMTRRASATMAGELVGMSYAGNVALSKNGGISNLTGKLFRSSPDGTLLGPIGATHMAVGDVIGRPSALGLGGSSIGLGATITNRPLYAPSTFDSTDYEGELPDGWEAELYRNGALVAFDNDEDGDGRYHFKNVGLTYGENDIQVVLYGPQGQVRHVNSQTSVGRDNVPPGSIYYWASVRQQGRRLQDLFTKAEIVPVEEAELDSGIASLDTDGAIEAEFEAQVGISKRMSAGALVRSLVIDDARVTFVEGSVRHSIGRAFVELAGAMDENGGYAARARGVAKIGKATISGGASQLYGFALTDTGDKRASDQYASVSIPLKLGKVSAPISVSGGHRVNAKGEESWRAATSLGARIGRFNLANRLDWEKGTLGENGESTYERMSSSAIMSTVLKGVRLRGSASFDIKPDAKFREAELTASWMPTTTSSLDGSLAYNVQSKRAKLQAGYSRQMKALNLTARANVDSKGAIGAGIGLNFSLDPARGRWKPTRTRLAAQGAVEARVFEDLNGNGRYDVKEPLMKNAYLTSGSQLSLEGSGEDGVVRMEGLAPYSQVSLGVDPSSLSNPTLTPLEMNQVVTPRPGVTAKIDIPLVSGGSIEGFMAFEDGRPFEGLIVELVDAKSGKIVAAATSEIDGYVLFEKVRYGEFILRLSKETAEVAGLMRDLGEGITIDQVRPVGRFGTIRVMHSPDFAEASTDTQTQL